MDFRRWRSLVQAWQRLPRPSEPFKPVNRASLPQLHRITAPEGERLQAAELPAIYGGGTEPPELWLPSTEPEIPGCPSWLLALFEQAGGVSSRQGRGAPWPMHIFIAAFLHLNIGDRNGEWRQLRFSREYVESWLHPDGWDRHNRRKHWHRFPEALHAVDRLRVYVPGVGDVRLVGVDTIPQKPTDSIVDFRVRIPKNDGARGADRLADTVQVPPGVLTPVSCLPVRCGAHGPDSPQGRTHYAADRNPDSEGGRHPEAEARRADREKHGGPDCSPASGHGSGVERCGPGAADRTGPGGSSELDAGAAGVRATRG